MHKKGSGRCGEVVERERERGEPEMGKGDLH